MIFRVLLQNIIERNVELMMILNRKVKNRNKVYLIIIR